MLRQVILSAVLAVCSRALPGALGAPQGSSGLLTPTVFYTFEPTAWLENFYVRQNGQFLVNSQSAPDLYQVDPFTAEAKLVHAFPNTSPGLTGLGGIVETTPDTFAVIVGDLNHTAVRGIRGSFSIWTIDLSGYPEKNLTAKKVVTLPNSSFLNGLTTLEEPTVILACDSVSGDVYRINTLTGECSIVIHGDKTTIPPTGSKFFVGIDGIRVFRPRNSYTAYLYYNNYVGGSYYRVPIDPVTGKPTGPIQVLATKIGLGLDDIEIDASGTSWISVAQDSRIASVRPGGQARIVSESKDLLYVTAVRKGRTCFDSHRLYFTTGLGKVGFIDTTKLA